MLPVGSKVIPIPVVNVQSSYCVYALQGPTIKSLESLYGGLPLIIIPALIYFGSGSYVAAGISAICILVLTPLASLNLLKVVIRGIRRAI